MGRGRLSKRTPEVVEKICHSLSIGLTNAQAAARAGIGEMTLQDWLREPGFQAQVEGAVAEKFAVLIEKVLAGKQGWQSASWWLERRDNRWARPEILLQLNQMAAAAQQASNSAIWMQTSTELVKDYPELEWTDSELKKSPEPYVTLPSSSAPETEKVRAAETRKYYATQAAILECEPHANSRMYLPDAELTELERKVRHGFEK